MSSSSLLAHTLERLSATLPGFEGSSEWVHALEGHDGGAYWPGGASGVTLDPGFDIGHADWELFERMYRPLLSARQMRACHSAAGLKGERARKFLQGSDALQTIRISRAQADRIFPIVALPYWQAITQRFPGLLRADTPPEAHTVMLSLAYNRGPWNKDLRWLAKPIENGDWAEVADLIEDMQNEHRLRGIRRRRDKEGRLLETGVERQRAEAEARAAALVRDNARRRIASLMRVPVRPPVALADATRTPNLRPLRTSD